MTRTMSDADVHAVAERHERARRNAVLAKRVTADFPDMTLDDAYACQQAWVDLQLAQGSTIQGHKIGLTSRAMQQAMNIDEPDFGALMDYMFISNGATLHAGEYNDPRIEVELAFVLSQPLFGSGVTPEDVYAATDHVVAALELIDSRTHRVDPDDGVTRTVTDTIADNAANAGIIVGDVRVAPGERDLRWVSAIMKRNGVVEETGVAAGVQNDPVTGIVWLVQRLSGLGITLEAGETILAGSFTRPVTCRPGDEFHVDFGDLGVITCSFD